MKRIQTEKELTTGASQQSSCDLVCQSKYSTSIAPKLLKRKKIYNLIILMLVPTTGINGLLVRCFY